RAETAGAEVVDAIAAIIGRDIAVVDNHCLHSWVGTGDLPEWFPPLAELDEARQRIRVPTVEQSSSFEVAHVVPLDSLPGALAVFRPSSGTAADQSTLLHAASALGTVLSRKEMLALQQNRMHSEYLSRILIDQNRFGFESAGWMQQLGYSGRV